MCRAAGVWRECRLAGCVPRNFHRSPEEILNTKILPQIPVGRLGKPEEVAGLIIYLASEEAAFLTGANIAINGGQHMQ